VADTEGGSGAMPPPRSPRPNFAVAKSVESKAGKRDFKNVFLVF